MYLDWCFGGMSSWGRRFLNLLKLSSLLPCQGPRRSLQGPAPYIQLTRDDAET